MRLQGLRFVQTNTHTGASETEAESEKTNLKLLRLSAALILVNAALLVPWWVLTSGFNPPWLAFEAVFVIGTFMILPRSPWLKYLARAAGLLVLFFMIVGLGETTMRLSLGRPLNLYVDYELLSSVWNLLVGTSGYLLAGLVLMTTSVVLPLVAVIITRLLVSIRVERDNFSVRVGGLWLIALIFAGLFLESVPLVATVVDFPTVRIVRDQGANLVAIIDERRQFAEELASYPDSYEEVPGLLSKLAGRDVIFGFIESYGVSAIDDIRYSEVVGPRIDDFQKRMNAAGLHLASGRLVAPSQGGQSWFGHGSVLSGVWLDTQFRYDMMLASGRETLIDDFQRIGHRTVAVMPAITEAWPEGDEFGYEEIYTHADIDYAGPPLNWVTMPDQFTWSFFENRIRVNDERPLFAELALISSHAPWTPILPVLEDWNGIGNGSVFMRFAHSGESPAELWRDVERVRDHYAMSIEYAVNTMVSYAERYVDESTLLVLLGDHQPASLITGEGAPWNVPVHVISGDHALVEPFIDWGFVEGAWPPIEAESETMGVDYFRDWFIHAYSGP